MAVQCSMERNVHTRAIMCEGTRGMGAIPSRGGGSGIGAARALARVAATPAAEGVLCLWHHCQQPPQ